MTRLLLLLPHLKRHYYVVSKIILYDDVLTHNSSSINMSPTSGSGTEVAGKSVEAKKKCDHLKKGKKTKFPDPQIGFSYTSLSIPTFRYNFLLTNH